MAVIETVDAFEHIIAGVPVYVIERGKQVEGFTIVDGDHVVCVSNGNTMHFNMTDTFFGINGDTLGALLKLAAIGKEL